MASIKIKGSLESSDLLGFPMNINLDQSFAGVGAGQSFQKFKTTLKATPANPTALPNKNFSSSDKKVYIYIKNTSNVAAEAINVYIKTTVLAATINALECATGCSDVVSFVRIANIASSEYLFIPLADQDTLYVDSSSGTPTLDYLVLEN